MTFGSIVYTVGRLPLLGPVLRKLANAYAEGSVTRIRSGRAAGLLWKRYRRYVNGYWLGIYEPPIQDALARYLKTGDVFYDVGANAGFFTLIASRIVGERGHVFAFEPLPENAGCLQEQIAINQLGNVTPVRMGVGKSPGEASFARTGHGSTARLANVAGDEVERLTISLTSIDEFAKSHKLPTFLKVDVEGAEDQVVNGAAETLRLHRPTFLFELHGPEVGRKVMQTLADAGYAFLTLDGQPVTPGDVPHHTIAVHKPSETAR
jgi:FkbM family methyltransferase